MRLQFVGKGTLKVQNKGWLSFLNKTTSKDFHETSKPLPGDNQSFSYPVLASPFPVIAEGKIEGGLTSLSIKILGVVSIPIFARQVIKVGDSVPVKWSLRGSTLGGAVYVVD